MAQASHLSWCILFNQPLVSRGLSLACDNIICIVYVSCSRSTFQVIKFGGSLGWMVNSNWPIMSPQLMALLITSRNKRVNESNKNYTDKKNHPALESILANSVVTFVNRDHYRIGIRETCKITTFYTQLFNKF